MNLFALFAIWLKGALKIHPNQLKGAPGIHDHEAAAAVVNAVVGSAIDAQAAAHGAAPNAPPVNPLGLLIPMQPSMPPADETPAPGG